MDVKQSSDTSLEVATQRTPLTGVRTVFQRVSVIILAKNEAEHIGRCIDSAFSSLERVESESLGLEVVVVDNESTDATARIAVERGAKLVRSGSEFLGELRNLGAAESSGDVLAYIDGDCSASPEWLASALRTLQLSDVHAVTGVIDLPEECSWVERAWLLPANPEPTLTSKVLGASFFCVREAFDAVDGFDDTMSAGEDSDLGTRLTAAGFRIRLEPDCRVIHWGYPSTLRGVIDRQAWHVGGRSGSTPVFRDRSVIAALVVVALLGGGLGLMAFGIWRVGFVAFVLGLIPPFIFLQVRRKRVRAKLSGWETVKAFVVSVAYFMGRAKGAVYRACGLRFEHSHKR